MFVHTFKEKISQEVSKAKPLPTDIRSKAENASGYNLGNITYVISDIPEELEAEGMMFKDCIFTKHNKEETIYHEIGHRVMGHTGLHFDELHRRTTQSKQETLADDFAKNTMRKELHSNNKLKTLPTVQSEQIYFRLFIRNEINIVKYKGKVNRDKRFSNIKGDKVIDDLDKQGYFEIKNIETAINLIDKFFASHEKTRYLSACNNPSIMLDVLKRLITQIKKMPKIESFSLNQINTTFEQNIEEGTYLEVMYYFNTIEDLMNYLEIETRKRIDIENNRRIKMLTKINMINVGQGDAILITTPEYYIMVDLGPSLEPVLQFLALKSDHTGVKKTGINLRSDKTVIVVTHGDTDHYGGRSMNMINFKNIMKSAGLGYLCGMAQYHETTEGDVAKQRLLHFFANGSYEIMEGLTPRSAADTYVSSRKAENKAPTDMNGIVDIGEGRKLSDVDGSNRNSIPFIQISESDIQIFTGDLPMKDMRIRGNGLMVRLRMYEEEFEAIKEICELNNKPLPQVLLKVPHHGSYENLSNEFFEFMAPYCSKFILFVSSGAYNKHEHPTADLLVYEDEDSNIKIYPQGSIIDTGIERDIEVHYTCNIKGVGSVVHKRSSDKETSVTYTKRWSQINPEQPNDIAEESGYNSHYDQYVLEYVKKNNDIVFNQLIQINPDIFLEYFNSIKNSHHLTEICRLMYSGVRKHVLDQCNDYYKRAKLIETSDNYEEFESLLKLFTVEDSLFLLVIMHPVLEASKFYKEKYIKDNWNKFGNMLLKNYCDILYTSPFIKSRIIEVMGDDICELLSKITSGEVLASYFEFFQEEVLDVILDELIELADIEVLLSALSYIRDYSYPLYKIMNSDLVEPMFFLIINYIPINKIVKVIETFSLDQDKKKFIIDSLIALNTVFSPEDNDRIRQLSNEDLEILDDRDLFLQKIQNIINSHNDDTASDSFYIQWIALFNAAAKGMDLENELPEDVYAQYMDLLVNSCSMLSAFTEINAELFHQIMRYEYKNTENWDDNVYKLFIAHKAILTKEEIELIHNRIGNNQGLKEKYIELYEEFCNRNLMKVDNSFLDILLIVKPLTQNVTVLNASGFTLGCIESFINALNIFINFDFEKLIESATTQYEANFLCLLLMDNRTYYLSLEEEEDAFISFLNKFPYYEFIKGSIQYYVNKYQNDLEYLIHIIPLLYEIIQENDIKYLNQDSLDESIKKEMESILINFISGLPCDLFYQFHILDEVPEEIIAQAISLNYTKDLNLALKKLSVMYETKPNFIYNLFNFIPSDEYGVIELYLMLFNDFAKLADVFIDEKCLGLADMMAIDHISENFLTVLSNIPDFFYIVDVMKRYRKIKGDVAVRKVLATFDDQRELKLKNYLGL